MSVIGPIQSHYHVGSPGNTYLTTLHTPTIDTDDHLLTHV